MDASAAISELVIANRVVAHLRLVDSFGHVTVRNPENPQRFFMSRSRAPGLVTKDEFWNLIWTARRSTSAACGPMRSGSSTAASTSRGRTSWPSATITRTNCFRWP